MSDNPTSIRVRIGKDEFDATPEALAELRSRGIDYKSGPDRAPGDGQRPWQAALETLGDTARGAVHGATLGLADMKFGDSNKSIPERLGAMPYEQVQERSPIASTVGDIGGSFVLPGGVLGKGAGLLARVGEQALVGGVTGGIREAAEGGSFAEGATTGALAGGIGAGVVSAAARYGGQGAKALGELLGSSADTLRARAAGVGATEMKGLAQRFGVDELPKAIAAHIENVQPSKGLGMSAATRATDLADRAEQVGPKIDEVLGKAGVDEHIPGAWEGMLARLEGRAGKLEKPTNVLPQQTSEAGTMRGAVDKLRQNSEAYAGEAVPETAADLRKVKSGWQREAYTGPGSSVPDTKNAAVAEAFGQEGRQALADVMSNATPQHLGEFEKLNKDYEGLALLRDMAAKRAATEGADSKIPGLLGAVGGGIIGGALSDEDGLMEGAAKGALVGGFSGTRNFASQALSGTRAMDATANALRLAQKKLSPAEFELFKTLAARAGTIAGLGADYSSEP